MFKIKNKSIGFSKITTKNRILDNYLDWVVFAILPRDIGYALFPKFYDVDEVVNTFYAFEYAYLKMNTPQTITDSSTSMSYTLMSQQPTAPRFTEVLGDNKKIVTYRALFDWTLLTPGDTFEGLGFGRNVVYIDDFLFSFVNIGFAEDTYISDYVYEVMREDEITTNETNISGGVGYLPGYTGGTLESIAMCFGSDGSGNKKEYHYSELTFTYVSAGNVSVTGFDDFYIEDNVLYPATDLYPDTDLYPTQSGEKIKSVVFTYADVDTPSTKYKAYINIEDLDVTYNGTDVSINLVCERG